MVHIKTKEGASLWIALLATAIVAVGMVIQHIEWWIMLCTSVGVFVVVALAALFIIRKYVAYKLQADLFDRAFTRRAHQRDLLGTEGQARREHRRGADGLGRHQRPGDRPAERGRVLSQAISGQRGPRTENPDIQYPGIYFDAAGRRAGGRTDQPQIPRTRREEHRPSDQHRQRPRHHFETRKQHEQAQSGAIRRGGAGQGDRRAGEMEADRKEIRFSVKGTDNLPSPFWVLADKHYIGQVFVNLIINSIRYGKEGGQTRIRFRDMLDKILIEVEDNGSGYCQGGPAACVRTLLPYGQGAVAGAGGTGLGLAIVKHIVEAHGERSRSARTRRGHTVLLHA